MKNIYLLVLFAAIIISGCKDDVVPERLQSLPDNHINAIHIDSDGIKYFATNKGLASFDGTIWKVIHDNPKITQGIINDLAFEITDNGPELWVATFQGVNVATLPVDASSGVTTYTEENTATLFPGQATMKGDSVTIIEVDNKYYRWFGTNKGLAVFKGNKWPSIQMGNHYPAEFFTINRVTSAASVNDTMYLGTNGGGVARFRTNDVDAVTAASPLEIPWSMLPSNNILSVFIDGAIRWFGTDEGLAKHWGKNAKKGWEQFYVSDGLLSNRIQCINKDTDGNLWIGTPEGLSVFDGTGWTGYTVNDGLAGNDVRCIEVDIDGTLWIGTTKGVSHFNGNSWVSYTTE